MASSKYRAEKRRSGFGLYLGASLLAHLLIAWLLLMTPGPTLPTPSVIEVSIEPSLSTNKEMIVSPSDKPSEKPPLNTNRISEKDSEAVIEQVRRGDNGGAQLNPQQLDSRPKSAPQPISPPQRIKENPLELKAPAERPSPHKPAEESPPTKNRRASNQKPLLKDLTLGDEVLEQRFAKNIQPAANQQASREATRDLSSYRAFSRPQGSGAAFIGSAGVSDHLPSLPDGDITLLNAKANTYAGFVRRVAVQVFAQLKSKGWERLSAGELRQLSNFTTVEAVLSADGKLLRTNIISGSGSYSFDGVVNQSAAAGARDPNPPPGARASDGLIHFIFKARSWSQVGVDNRSGLPSERRWLLLATGLE